MEESEASYHNKFVFLNHKKSLMGASFEKELLEKVQEIAAKGTVAIIAAINQPSQEIYLYNVTASDPQLPIPLIMVRANDKASIESAIAKKTKASLTITGHYKENSNSRNIIAQRGDRSNDVIVISTPLSGRFVNTAERGPGNSFFSISQVG